MTGSLLEFLCVQGLGPAQASTVRLRFDSWMRVNRRHPVPVSLRPAPPTKLYAFADLMEPWNDYKAMRADMGREIC